MSVCGNIWELDREEEEEEEEKKVTFRSTTKKKNTKKTKLEIFSSSNLYTADGVTKYPVRGIWLSALYQAITTFVAEGIALVVDAIFHGIDYRRSWPLTRKGALTFLGWLLLIGLVGGSRICFDILILFCPSVNAEGKAMMSFCNVPSLFDRI